LVILAGHGLEYEDHDRPGGTMPTAQPVGNDEERNDMYRPPREEEPQVSFDDLMERIRSSIPQIPGLGGGSPAFLVIILILVIAVIWLATGIYTVGPDEQAAVKTFGKFTRIDEQGFHYHWPAPVGHRDVVAVTTTRRLEIGFRSGSNGAVAQKVQTESLMITGDENIVDVEAVVQYRIINLRDFLYSVDDPGDPDRNISSGRPDGRTLRDVAESAIRQVIGSRNIDDVLTTEREQVATDILLKIREIVSDYDTGLEIQTVLLQNVNPPAEVQDAFEDVVRANEERERTINLAQAYEADQLPRAQGQSAQIQQEAEAFKQGRVAEARGEAEGFLALLEGYNTSPDVTRRRLYLEAIEEILPGLKKFILDDQGVLPFLPLDGDTPTTVPGGGS
jgi:membrane protease subunit HflK